MPPKTPIKSPKVQQNANTWSQCTACGFVILKVNNEKHECFKVNESQAHLFKRELHNASITEHPKDIDKDLEITKEFLFDFIFMSPQTMNLCNFKIGSAVVIEISSASYTAATCWPLMSQPIEKVSLNKQYILLNNLSTESMVQRVFSVAGHCVLKATQITLNLLANKSAGSLNETDKQLLISYLKEIYINKCVTKSQLLSCNFMGQRFTFEISNVVSIAKKTTVNDLNEKFQNILKIKDDEAAKEFSEVNLTPVEPTTEKGDVQLHAIDRDTNFKVENMKQQDKSTTRKSETKVTFKQVGGLQLEIEMLKELFIYPFDMASLYENIGLELSKGVLLFGSSGCGKTLVAKALCNERKCNFVEINCSEVFSRNYGESETKLKEFFNNAWSSAPCIVFIDELDTLCAKRESLHQDLEKRIVSLFLSLMDQSMAKNILFLATTNKIDSLDLSLRRPGRFDKEIEIPIPNQSYRYEILKIHLEAVQHVLGDEEIVEVSQNCHGYVGADLKMLVYEAGLMCIKRSRSQSASSPIGIEDFYAALHKVKPSAMREITFDIPKVYWSDIGGQDDLKKKLQQAVIWPIKYASSFKQLGIKAPRGLLMYGPPGCSKTMIAKALATETGLNFIAVKGPELFSKWVGESERTVREIFRKARTAAPAIIFFDEIDAVAVERSNSASKSNNVGDRVLAQLLNEIDGVENLTDVTIVAATNRPDMIDKALMRPGRLDRIVYVKLPDEATRREIFKLKFKKMPIDDDVNVNELVKQTEKYSGAEITAVCNEAAYLALEQDINSTRVNQKHFEGALKIVYPRTSQETIDYFDSFHSITSLHNI